MVKVSSEYFVELNQQESLNYVDKKEKLLNAQLTRLENSIAETKAHLSFVNTAVSEILNFSSVDNQAT